MPGDPLPITAEPNLDSFVLRFVRNVEGLAAGSAPQTGVPRAGAAQPANWHGVIRHVQSNRERAFCRWTDAVAFINEFVNVQESENVQEKDNE